jgi:hypothetical protein
MLSLYSENLTKEAVEGFGDFRRGGEIIRAVKYADDLVLLAKKETSLQGMSDRLIATGSCRGMEMSEEKTEVMRLRRNRTQDKL